MIQTPRQAALGRSILLLALSALVACGADATLSATGNGVDASASDADLVGDLGVPDAAPEDVQQEPDDRSDFLEPCEDDEDCLSGFCIQTEQGYVCSDFCTPTSCPEGWGCRVLETTGADVVRICVPNPDSLCSPCNTNIDCGRQGNLCIDVGGDRFCGRDCSEGEDVCPDGFFCSLRVDAGGQQGRQCVPLSERCSCRPEVDGTDRPCVRQNEIGVCEGIEVCLGEDGWSACTATVPTDEICDGLDNDCDGLVDENVPPRPCFSTPNELGTCEGVEVCRGALGWECDAEPASIEICDGLDNDCNDTVDDGLCFDGNPCTLDLCNPENPGGCNYPPRAGECDDADLCTESDRCIDGACVGSDRDCDDMNGCTADSCNPVEGCVHSNLDGVPCEAGSFCTVDTCQDGACVTGPAEQCGGSNECNLAGCDPATGCTLERLTGNPCDDDDACTVNDACSNGICIEGTPFCAGRSCPDCPGQVWSVDFGFCIELFGSPVCTCICIGG